MDNALILDTIVKIGNRCMADSMELCSLAGISPSESNLLLLMETGERLTCSELSRRASLSPSRVTRIVDGLTQKGYLVRETAERDRRITEISLSRGGAACRKKLQAARLECEERLRSRLGDGELARVEDAFALVLRALGDDR